MQSSPEVSWPVLVYRHGRAHTLMTIGLSVALLAVLILLGQSFLQIASWAVPPGLQLALIGGLPGFVATTLGALPALAMRGLSQRVEDSLLGFAAGMMLAISAFSLLLPGLDAASALMMVLDTALV